MKKLIILLLMLIVFAAYGEGITCKAYEASPTSYQIFWLSGYYRALDYAFEETQDVLILNMLLSHHITLGSMNKLIVGAIAILSPGQKENDVTQIIKIITDYLNKQN